MVRYESPITSLEFV